MDRVERFEQAYGRRERAGDAGPPAALGAGELIGGILGDTRDLIGAHADRLRAEAKNDVREIRRVVITTAVAAVASLLALMLLCAALVITLEVIGVPRWLSAWIVFVVFGAAAGVTIARVMATRIDDHTVEELKSARDDMAWAGEKAVKSIQGDPATPAPPPTPPLH